MGDEAGRWAGMLHFPGWLGGHSSHYLQKGRGRDPATEGFAVWPVVAWGRVGRRLWPPPYVSVQLLVLSGVIQLGIRERAKYVILFLWLRKHTHTHTHTF